MSVSILCGEAVDAVEVRQLGLCPVCDDGDVVVETAHLGGGSQLIQSCLRVALFQGARQQAFVQFGAVGGYH